MLRLTKRTLFISMAALLSTAALSAGVLNSTGGSGGVHSGEAPPALTPFTLDGEIEILLMRLGFSEEAVAAAGISGSQFQALLAASQDATGFGTGAGIASLPAELRDLDNQVAEAKRSMDALRRTVQSGLATEEQIAQLATAKQAHESATAARQTFFDSTCMTLCGLLPAGQSAVLMQICDNKGRHLPAPYLAEERTQAEWIRIRNAVASKRTHEELGEAVPASALATLAEFDARIPVSTAKASCNAELPGVETTWDAIFSE